MKKYYFLVLFVSWSSLTILNSNAQERNLYKEDYLCNKNNLGETINKPAFIALCTEKGFEVTISDISDHSPIQPKDGTSLVIAGVTTIKQPVYNDIYELSSGHRLRLVRISLGGGRFTSRWRIWKQ